MNKVTTVYSEAFFELSKEKDKLDKSLEDIKYVNKTIKNHKEMNGFLKNPNILKEDKKELIGKVFVDIDQDSKNLLNVLIEKSRFEIFEDLVRDFNKRYNSVNNIAEGIVYSVNKLDQEEMNSLVNVLAKKLDKKVELTNELDSSLIGGVSVFIDGKRMDNSIKYRLDSLKSSLKERR